MLSGSYNTERRACVGIYVRGGATLLNTTQRKPNANDQQVNNMLGATVMTEQLFIRGPAMSAMRTTARRRRRLSGLLTSL